MSEVYREETHDESGSSEGSCDDQNVGIETENFVWEDVLEEISRFENFDLAMKFTTDEWASFSGSLRSYILAKRLLFRIPIETNPSSNAGDRVPGCPTSVDMEAKRSSDVNVTVRPRTSNRVEQETVESGNEDIGSSMQRIGSNLLHVAAVRDHSDELEPTTNNLPGDAYDTSPGDFEDLMKMVVLKEDFKSSMDTITRILEQIPHDLDAHEVVLKNDFAIMGDNLRHELVEEVGTVLRTALTGTAIAPTLGHSVDIRVPFLPSTPPGLVTQIRLPNGLNSPLPTGYAMQAPMGTVMSQRGNEYAS